jgi:hypothetical protein
MRGIAAIGLGLACAVGIAEEARAQSRADCEGGIRFITEALAGETRADVRNELAKALRDAERELGEGEYDECMEAVEDARDAVGGAPAAARRPREADELLQADDGLPVTVEDAFVPRRGEIEARLGFSYNRLRRFTLETEDDDDDDDDDGGAARKRSGRDQFVTDAEVEIGLGNGLAAMLGASYVLGNAEDVKNGEFELGGKWNFLAQQEWFPALTIAAEVSLPFGFRNDSTETTVGLLASKALGSGPDAPYLHANIFWIHAFNREEDARANRFVAVLGATVPITTSTALALDLVHGKDEEKGQITNLVEVGVRQMLPGGFRLGLGVGAGFGGSTTDFRALFGLQKEF